MHDNTYQEDDDNASKHIEVVIGNRYIGWIDKGSLPAGWNERSSMPAERNTSNNITVRKDNKRILASKLPTIFVTNHRSFFPKFRNFVDAMQTVGLTLGLHSEIWEVKENKTKVISANLLDSDFDFEDIIMFGNISVLVTFQFSEQFSFVDISALLIFQFW